MAVEEFMAHSGNVNCLSLAKKRRGLFITGGDDHIVNLWSIGKPTALTVSSKFFEIKYNVSSFNGRVL